MLPIAALGGPSIPHS